MNKNCLEYNYTQTVKDGEGWIIYVFNFLPILWRWKHMCQDNNIYVHISKFWTLYVI